MKIKYSTINTSNDVIKHYIYINSERFEEDWLYEFLDDIKYDNVCIREQKFRDFLLKNKICKKCGTHTFGGAELDIEGEKLLLLLRRRLEF